MIARTQLAQRPTNAGQPYRYARRGVSSILAMMFLVIFGSLAAVMAVVAQGNLRTAHSYHQANRALSAAEIGLTFAADRLAENAGRFITEKGVIDSDYGESLWIGTWDGLEWDVDILPPENYEEEELPTGIADALLHAHEDDDHNLDLEAGDELLPDIDEFGNIYAPPVAVDDDEHAPTFRLTYEPLADGRYVRVTSQGRDGELTRTISADFLITKRLDAAIISPNRIMIGKNVHIEGPIGSRYGETESDLEEENGHPIVMRSDFLDLDDTLDDQIYTLIDSIAEYDVNADNRLRPGHPTESSGLTEGYMEDNDQDGFVDDYDLWMGFYDGDEDRLVVYDEDLAFDAGYGMMSEEFTGIDDQLVALIDTLNPDRNHDGVNDGLDVAHGYLDGVISSLDGYSKINGSLLFKASKSAWETGQGDFDFQSVVNGSMHQPDPDDPTVMFEVPDSRLYDLENSDFSNSQDALKYAALNGLSFFDQLAAQLGGPPEDHVWTDDSENPDYLRQEDSEYEQMPYGSTGFYDWYKRAIYKNITFVNVKIPMGNNGLFVNCTFIGAVYVESYTDNEHVNWNFLGMKEKVGSEWVDKYDYFNWDPPLEIDGSPVYDTKPFSNNIRCHDCTIIGSFVTDPVTDFTHVRNKLQYTGDTQFTLDSEDIWDSNLSEEEKGEAYDQFNEDLSELEKSSLMAPNFSVDIGNFTNEDARIVLKGTIVSGVLDIRGNADVIGTLLMTFKAVAGEGVLFYGGSTASFNTTIGYFGPEDGDGEGSEPSPEVGYGNITITYDPDLPLPDGIMAPCSVGFVEGTYTEGCQL